MGALFARTWFFWLVVLLGTAFGAAAMQSHHVEIPLWYSLTIGGAFALCIVSGFMRRYQIEYGNE